MFELKRKSKVKIIEEEVRFVLYYEDKEAGEMTFMDREGYFIVDSTYVDPAYTGKHLAEELLAAGVKKARHEGRKLYPLCPFAEKEFNRRPDYADVRALEMEW